MGSPGYGRTTCRGHGRTSDGAGDAGEEEEEVRCSDMGRLDLYRAGYISAYPPVTMVMTALPASTCPF